ncbi:hypothetical protein [Ruminococcus sp.]|uniref:hypothetical protein n=1 Tax=Ruminococcus sp. TaxID=41978 RepID=UPI0025F5C784|nr:hypothetical protein [Ruminococcus sp.]
MDRFEKHAEYIMKRGDKILAEREKRNKCIRRITLKSSCGFAAVIVCVLVCKVFPVSKDISKDSIINEGASLITSTNINVTTQINNSIIATVNSTDKNQNTFYTTVDDKIQKSTTTVFNTVIETESGQTYTVSHNTQIVITSLQVDSNHEADTSSTTVEPFPEYVSEVFWGYNENNSINPDSLINQNIAMKCKSFCAAGEKLRVDVAMADARLDSLDYENAGDYEFEVYRCDPSDYKNIDDNHFIVNGEHKRYRKEYSRGEVEGFDIKGKIDDYDSYHHETTELDFSNYEVGSSGCIKFAFKVEYTDDPLHNTCMIANQYMYFYVSGDGTFISNKEIEHSKDDISQIDIDKRKRDYSRENHNHHSWGSMGN